MAPNTASPTPSLSATKTRSQSSRSAEKTDVKATRAPASQDCILASTCSQESLWTCACCGDSEKPCRRCRLALTAARRRALKMDTHSLPYPAAIMASATTRRRKWRTAGREVRSSWSSRWSLRMAVSRSSCAWMRPCPPAWRASAAVAAPEA
uniref:Uncharacterized protein n=1 Tax=Triticum urartu TaxID=4572 RepID=A0A8R7R9D5_TRIUA